MPIVYTMLKKNTLCIPIRQTLGAKPFVNSPKPSLYIINLRFLSGFVYLATVIASNEFVVAAAVTPANRPAYKFILV